MDDMHRELDLLLDWLVSLVLEAVSVVLVDVSSRDESTLK